VCVFTCVLFYIILVTVDIIIDQSPIKLTPSSPSLTPSTLPFPSPLLTFLPPFSNPSVSLPLPRPLLHLLQSDDGWYEILSCDRQLGRQEKPVQSWGRAGTCSLYATSDCIVRVRVKVLKCGLCDVSSFRAFFFS
jgi:hypothetical protein